MDYAIYTEALTKTFGSFTAVNAVSLRIKAGEIYGLLGSSGSGKSTIIRMLCGVLTPTSGTIRILGSSDIPAMKPQIGYMSQKFSLYPTLTVLENLKLYAQIYGLDAQTMRTRIEQTLQAAGVRDKQDDLVQNLTGGWKQRLALGCAMLHEPKLLFLDEATSGADPRTRRDFWQIIQKAAATGVTVLVTTHIMEEAAYCSTIGFLHQGTMLVTGSPDEVKRAVPGQPSSLNEVFSLLVKRQEA